MLKSKLIPNTWNVEGNSLIQFQGVYSKEIPQTDWIFFTSKNAVRYFFKQGHTIDNRQVACIGEGTYKILKSKHSQIDFVGNNIDIQTTGKEFSQLVGDKSCLFPISNISRRSIQKAFINENQVHDLVVYETFEKKDFIMNPADILIFTSPSNVRSFFKKCALKQNQKTIAMGPSTANQLKKLQVNHCTIPTVTGEIGLIDAIHQTLQS